MKSYDYLTVLLRSRTATARNLTVYPIDDDTEATRAAMLNATPTSPAPPPRISNSTGWATLALNLRKFQPGRS